MATYDLHAIIFDMDGVIIDSEPLHDKALRIACAHWGVAVTAADETAFRGVTDNAVAATLLARHPHLPWTQTALIERKDRVYLELFGEVPLVAGVSAFLQHLSSRSVPMALATSALASNQQLTFARFELAPFFGAVVTSEDVRHGKPHPEPYLLAATRLGVLPQHCLVIEDSVNGVRSGKAAGCQVAGITTAFAQAELATAGADVVVDTFEELQRWLETHWPSQV